MAMSAQFVPDAEPLWRPVFVLPNLALTDAIEAGQATIAPSGDSRVQAIINAHPLFASFMNRFTDAFGEKVSPAVMLLAPDAPDGYRTTEAVAGFRDAFAISVTALSWASQLAAPWPFRTFYSDAFGFYPWMLDRDFEHLMAQTPAMMGVHITEEFHGQPTPAVPQAPIGAFEIDEHLLSALLSVWRRRYVTRRPKWRDVALFRSLNMAQQASRAPAGADATIYDLGRQISLWVSAFEILAHTGAGGRSDLGKVVDLIESAPWRSGKCRRKKYQIIKGRGRRQGGLGPKIYRTLYDLRNDFLHGNPITRSKLTHATRLPEVSWAAYAAPLYRVTLLSFLQIESAPSTSARRIPRDLSSEIAARLADEHSTFEKAILTASGGWR